MRLRARHGRGRRQSEPAGAAGWAGQERVEREFAAVDGMGRVCVGKGGKGECDVLGLRVEGKG